MPCLWHKSMYSPRRVYKVGSPLSEIATCFGMLGNMSEQLVALVMIAPGLLALAAVFSLLGLSLVPFAIGLALITPFLGTLLVLGTMLPLITGALGIGGCEGGGETAGAGGDGDPLLEEIKGLRQDIQAQPIQVVFDNKVVSEITKVQRVRQSRGT